MNPLRGMPTPYRVALTMARKSEYIPYKIGACVSRGRRVISAGYNQIKTHPLMLRFRNEYVTGLHAEMHACVGVDLDSLNGADIYVVRLRKDGSLGMARPCKLCREYLADMGVRRAYFSTSEEKFDMILID